MDGDLANSMKLTGFGRGVHGPADLRRSMGYDGNALHRGSRRAGSARRDQIHAAGKRGHPVVPTTTDAWPRAVGRSLCRRRAGRGRCVLCLEPAPSVFGECVNPDN